NELKQQVAKTTRGEVVRPDVLSWKRQCSRSSKFEVGSTCGSEGIGYEVEKVIRILEG
ncbi:hypothetical protein A2U01_0042315, partial [Trifolium medium]|nr:hypothetical protein [Trifolium medium]